MFHLVYEGTRVLLQVIHLYSRVLVSKFSPVVTKDLLLDLGEERALGAGVLGQRLPFHPSLASAHDALFLGLDVRHGVRRVRTVVVHEQQVDVGGVERALVAQVHDGGPGRRWGGASASAARGELEQEEGAVRAGALAAGEGVGDLAQVLFGAAEASWAEGAVLDGALVDAVRPLVVAQQRRHHDHLGPVVHGVAEVAELAVVAGHHPVGVHTAPAPAPSAGALFLPPAVEDRLWGGSLPGELALGWAALSGGLAVPLLVVLQQPAVAGGLAAEAAVLAPVVRHAPCLAARPARR